jgi:ParB family chromosome partitioning protein
MKTQRIELIPISEIRVANPRSRNKVTFQTIVTSIDKVGLKKPVTLSRRDADTDGTHYDLVCGQGRLEAVAALGDTTVPAIVIDAPPKKRSIMSLIENVARRRPSNWELLREVRSLKGRGYKSKIIAEKIGCDVTYIDGIILLLRKGEEKLIAQVEAGTLPLSVAMKIASASNQEVQQALAEAYDKGDLRGEKLRAVQRLITQRFAKDHSAGSKPERKVTGKDLVREYERYVQRQKTLLRRASVVSQRLALLMSTLKRLRSDEHFVTLLRAESLEKLPEALSKRLA